MCYLSCIKVQRQSHRECVLVLRIEPVFLNQEHYVPYKLRRQTYCTYLSNRALQMALTSQIRHAL